MKVQIDNDGLFVADADGLVIGDVLENDVVVGQVVDVDWRPGGLNPLTGFHEGFHHAKWEGGTWVEGLPTDQLAVINADKAQKDLLVQLKATDKEIPRYLEDLTDTLIANGSLALADLPQQAQDNLANKKALRAQVI